MQKKQDQHQVQPNDATVSQQNDSLVSAMVETMTQQATTTAHNGQWKPSALLDSPLLFSKYEVQAAAMASGNKFSSDLSRYFGSNTSDLLPSLINNAEWQNIVGLAPSLPVPDELLTKLLEICNSGSMPYRIGQQTVTVCTRNHVIVNDGSEFVQHCRTCCMLHNEFVKCDLHSFVCAQCFSLGSNFKCPFQCNSTVKKQCMVCMEWFSATNISKHLYDMHGIETSKRKKY